MRRRRITLPLIASLILLLILTAVAAVLLFGIADFDAQSTGSRVARIEQIVMLSAQQCYALEGAYPESIEYLRDHYGLVMDTGRYIYHYDRFAANIAPEVRVFERKADN